MNKLILKLRAGLKKLLSFVGGTFAKVLATELVKTYILTKTTLAIALATLTVWSSQFSQFSSTLLGYRLLQTPIYINISKAAGALIILYSVGWFGYKTCEYISKKKKKPYYFVTVGSVKWYVNRVANEVSIEPYCEEHQYRLEKSWFDTNPYRESEYNYYCPYCKKNKLELITDKEFSKLYTMAARTAQALNLGHAKGFTA